MAGNYIHPAQEKQEKHEKKRQKKKKNKTLIFLIVLALLIVCLLLLFNALGLGLGGGKGEGDGGKDSSSAAESAADSSVPDDSSEVEKNVFRVRISGSSYICDDKVYTLDEFKTFVEVMDKNTVIIELLDDNAVTNAVESMHSMLDELQISYTDSVYSEAGQDTQADTSSSAEDTSAAY